MAFRKPLRSAMVRRWTPLLLVVLVGGVSLRPHSCQGDPTNVVPVREVQLLSPTIPEWKSLWDQARVATRNHRLSEARVLYQHLLEVKANVDEARWEYANVLMLLKQWSAAARELDLLSHREPMRSRLSLARASVALALGDAQRAIHLYGQLYERNPAGPDAEQALLGLIDAMEAAGRQRFVLPLMEQLRHRRPMDLGLMQRMALVAASLGDMERARQLLIDLQTARPEDTVVQSQLIAVEQALSTQQGTRPRGRTAALVSGLSREEYRLLAQERRRAKDADGELRLLEQLLGQHAEDLELVLRVANLNMQMGQAARALHWYGQASRLKADDALIQALQRTAREKLAGELLELVQLMGADYLWTELELLHERTAVYQVLAGLLRKEGRVTELRAVLEILNRQDPMDQQIQNELAMLPDCEARVEVNAAEAN